MKKQYEKPVAIKVEVNYDDVIVTSGVGECDEVRTKKGSDCTELVGYNN